MSDTAEEIQRIASALIDRGVRRIHSFSWRDLDDAEAGGSEVHHDHVFRRWAAAGLDISHRSSSLVGPRDIERNGYRIRHRGSRYTVFPRAIAAEALHRAGPRDAVVEIWNGVPWFSPVWHRGPQTTWLHHVHGPMWDQSLPGPVAPVGRVLESRVAPRFYRRHPVITLAEASRDELLHLGFRDVRVVPPGIDAMFTPDPAVDRSPEPLIVATGRLSPVKRFDLLLDAVADVRRIVPTARLVIVGEGPERPALESWIADHGAQDWATLAGRVSDADLVDTYRRAWVLASASLAEGWGMTITEAAACGTPAVATDVVGHRGAIVDTETGVLVASPAELSGALSALLVDHDRRRSLGSAALQRSEFLTWDATAAATLQVLLDDVMAR